VRSPRFLSWLLWLLPASIVVAEFGGCGIAVEGGSSVTGTGTVSVSASSGGGAGGYSGTGGGAPGRLATRCHTDGECGGDLSCLLPTDVDPIFGGGAPGGFCTRPCTGDPDCAEDDGVCYKVDPTQPGRCTLSCTLGPAIPAIPILSTQVDWTKCRSREDVRCASSATGSGVCLPTCGEDAQCNGGYCDPRTALCSATPSTGAPTGTTCDQSQSPSACAGLCVGFEAPVTICTEPCVLGDPPLQSANCGGPTQGLCAFHPPPNGAGDNGFCTPSCTAQSGCQTPSFWCFGVPAVTTQLHVGYCFAATPCPNGQGDCDAAPDGGAGDGGVADAGEGDAGVGDAGAAGDAGIEGPGDAGTGDGGSLCTATPFGPYCLDPAFPVDLDAGVGDAGQHDAAP
jgi:hypothetical protein